jgi:hypothetical protein
MGHVGGRDRPNSQGLAHDGLPHFIEMTASAVCG